MQEPLSWASTLLLFYSNLTPCNPSLKRSVISSTPSPPKWMQRRALLEIFSPFKPKETQEGHHLSWLEIACNGGSQELITIWKYPSYISLSDSMLVPLQPWEYETSLLVDHFCRHLQIAEWRNTVWNAKDGVNFKEISSLRLEKVRSPPAQLCPSIFEAEILIHRFHLPDHRF